MICNTCAGIAPDGVLRIVDQLQAPDVRSNTSGYLAFNGLYRRTQPAVYSEQTRLAIRAEDLQTFSCGGSRSRTLC